MRILIVLSGVSGTGKTHFRTHHEDYRDLPQVDIADVYRDNPFIPRGMAAVASVWPRVMKAFERGDEVILEGYFLRDSQSRWTLNRLASRSDVEVRYLNFWAPLEVCEDRLTGAKLRGEITEEEYETRLSMLRRCWTPKEN